VTELGIAPLLVALVSGAVTLALGRWPRVQRWASVLGVLAYATAVGALVWTVVFGPETVGAGTIAYQVGGWEAPFGITVVADPLSAVMLSITGIVAVYAILFENRRPREMVEQLMTRSAKRENWLPDELKS